MYKYLFGPVPSRRLGMSLGVDLIPHKVCTLNCIYCECGVTTCLTTDRKEYIPSSKVIKELEQYFKENRKPDYITFSGAGEPLLNSSIGLILNWIKTNIPDVPAAVLTNGTLLSDPDVRKEILKADLVIPSLDAACEESFAAVDRPHESISLPEYIQGLIDFRNEYSGKIWLEIFILPDYNNSEKNLFLLQKALKMINPDRIQLNTLDRPGTVSELRAASKAELQSILDSWGLPQAEIIKPAPERKDIKSYRKDTETAILETICRRPCTLKDLSSILGIHINEINKYLGVLEEEESVSVDVQKRGVFYTAVR